MQHDPLVNVEDSMLYHKSAKKQENWGLWSYNCLVSHRRSNILAAKQYLERFLHISAQSCELGTDSIQVEQRHVDHTFITSVALEVSLVMILAPHGNISQLQDFQAVEVLKLKRDLGEQLSIQDDSTWYSRHIAWWESVRLLQCLVYLQSCG